LVDLDGDGKTDVLSGSYHPGHLYLFRRGPEAQFLPGEKIKDRHGKELEFVASVPFAADWNGDGLLDLIVGNIQGEVYFVPNEGTPKQYAFGSPQKLAADGKPIEAPHGDAGPVVADWDGDGLPDLIVGCGDGSVVWYRNIGAKKEPKLAPGKTLVKACPTNEVWSGGLKENQCGARAKICVADWNGDGKLDLILGDLSVSKGEKPKLTKEDEEAIEKAQKRQDKIIAEYTKHSQEFLRVYQTVNASGTAEAKRDLQKCFQQLMEAGNEAGALDEAPADETPEAKTNREKKLQVAREKLDKTASALAGFDKGPANEKPEAKKEREQKVKESAAKYATLQYDLRKVMEITRKGQAQSNYHGHVWVFLRQGRVVAKP
jgi:hypothetical protein